MNIIPSPIRAMNPTPFSRKAGAFPIKPSIAIRNTMLRINTAIQGTRVWTYSRAPAADMNNVDITKERKRLSQLFPSKSLVFVKIAKDIKKTIKKAAIGAKNVNAVRSICAIVYLPQPDKNCTAFSSGFLFPEEPLAATAMITPMSITKRMINPAESVPKPL